MQLEATTFPKMENTLGFFFGSKVGEHLNVLRITLPGSVLVGNVLLVYSLLVNFLSFKANTA